MTNSVVLLGRLTKDPELRYLQGSTNKAVARFTLAVDKGLSREKKQEMESRNQPTADFINCQTWGKIAENVAKFTGKGLRVLVNGRIQTGSYGKDGQTVYTTDVVVANIEFIDWKDKPQNTAANNTRRSNSDNPMDFAPSGVFDFSDDFVPTAGDSRIPF